MRSVRGKLLLLSAVLIAMAGCATGDEWNTTGHNGCKGRGKDSPWKGQ